MSFMDLAKERYSCRQFTDKKVEQEKIDKILDSAIIAPTATNAQPFKVWVLSSEEAIAKVSKATVCMFGTKLVFVIGAKKDSAWVRPFDDKNFAEIDASIVATHMLLQIHDLGLGTTWVGYFEDKILKEEFPEMAGYEIVALLPTGYPADDAAPSPKHVQYKSKEELTQTL